MTASLGRLLLDQAPALRAPAESAERGSFLGGEGSF